MTSSSTGDVHGTPSAGWGRQIAAPLTLIILVFLTFMPALQAGLVNWDDDALLLRQVHHQSLTLDHLRWMFTTSYTGHFQPLTWLSYALDHALWREEWLGYHLTNVALHACAAVTFYFVARRLLAAALSETTGLSSRPLILSALLAALLFAIHPLRVESVAWLAERRDVLSGFLYLLTVACYLRYVRSNGSESAPPSVALVAAWPAYAAALLFATLASLAKAVTMTLPFVLLILDRYPLRRLATSIAERKNRARHLVTEKLPFFLLALAVAARAFYAQQESGALHPVADHDWSTRLAQACHGAAFYVLKTVWPANLGPLYEIPAREILLGSMLWKSLTVIAFLTFCAIAGRRKYPGLLAALACYGVTLAPVLGFAQSGPQLVADRYSYLSCLGFAILGGGVCFRLAQARSSSLSGRRGAWVALLAAAVVTFLMHAAFRQTDYWQSPLMLWARGIQVSPDSAIAHVNYADALARTEQWARADEHYRRALERNPRDPVALHHMGNLLELNGDANSAIGYYLRSLSIDPNRRSACFSLAKLLLQRDRAAQGITVLRDGVQRHPEALEMIDLLADVLATHRDERLREGAEALRWARRANDARGGKDARTLMLLATALAETGRYDEALQIADRALALATARGDLPLLADLEHRVALFQQRQPFRRD